MCFIVIFLLNSCIYLIISKLKKGHFALFHEFFGIWKPLTSVRGGKIPAVRQKPNSRYINFRSYLLSHLTVVNTSSLMLSNLRNVVDWLNPFKPVYSATKEPAAGRAPLGFYMKDNVV